MAEPEQTVAPGPFAHLSNEEVERRHFALQRMLRATEAREDLLKFVQFLMPDPAAPYDVDRSTYKVAPHHRLIAEALERVERGEMLRLAVSVGPQTGKSTLISRAFPAWYSGRHPEHHIMLGTYSDTFAMEFGEDVRTIMTSNAYRLVFPRHGLREGSRAKDHMVTTSGGKLAFLGRGGAAAGRPANIFLIDDPIKNHEEAASLTIRDQTWNWFTRVVMSRAIATTALIAITTRWHEDDIIGRLTDPSSIYYNADVAKQWIIINIPTLMDDPEMSRAMDIPMGESIWEERKPKRLLEEARKLDPTGFEALYQGRPTPPEGAFFKQSQIKTYPSDQEMVRKPDGTARRFRYYLTGDLAVSTDRTANKSCVGVWALDESDTLWLLPELYWDRKSSDESVDTIIDMGKRWTVMEAYFEKGQLDKAIGPFLDKRQLEEMRKDHRAYFPIMRLPVSGDKGRRAQSIRGRMAQGKVRFPGFASWWPAAKEELLKFTGSGEDKSDDFVDMCSLIGQALGEQVLPATPEMPQNVIRIGTLRWVKMQSDREKHEREIRLRMRGR